DALPAEPPEAPEAAEAVDVAEVAEAAEVAPVVPIGLTDLATAVEADHGAEDRSWRPAMVSPRPVLRPEQRPAHRPPSASTAPWPSVDAPVRRVVPAPVAPAGAHPVPPSLAPGAPVHHPGVGGVATVGRPPGRGWVTWRLGVAAVSLASCQPVGVT